MTTDAGFSKEVADFEKLFPDSDPGRRCGEIEFACMKEFVGSMTSTTDRGVARPAQPVHCWRAS